MTQQVLLARCNIPCLSGVSDTASIDLRFEEVGTPTMIDLAALQTALVNFFTVTAAGATQPVNRYLSAEVNLSTNAASIEFYDITAHLNGSPAGSPYNIFDFTIGGATHDDGMPSGVAACVSYKSDYGTDVEFAPGARPRSRDRNRFYLGPLGTSAFSYETVTNRPRLAPVFMTNVLAALQALALTTSSGGHQCQLVVWSRKNAAVKQANQAWMDDRPDYQRRRSDPNPGSKTIVALT